MYSLNLFHNRTTLAFYCTTPAKIGGYKQGEHHCVRNAKYISLNPKK